MGGQEYARVVWYHRGAYTRVGFSKSLPRISKLSLTPMRRIYLRTKPFASRPFCKMCMANLASSWSLVRDLSVYGWLRCGRCSKAGHDARIRELDAPIDSK
jgi:hypothetical protein